MQRESIKASKLQRLSSLLSLSVSLRLDDFDGFTLDKQLGSFSDIDDLKIPFAPSSFTRESARSRRRCCINAPLRYAEFAENEVKRNRTLRCSREDCSDAAAEEEGEEGAENTAPRGLHGWRS